MIKTTNRLFMSAVIFCAAFMLQAAHAGEVLAPVAATGQLAMQLPDVDHEALIELLGTLRSQLIQRKQELIESVADKKLDGGDAFITAILPGGLLYAGYKKARYEQAKEELARVNADIKELAGDLQAMQSMSPALAVAQLR